MSDYSSNFPQQRPKLNLVFNSGSDKLDSRLSYSRSSTGAYLSNEKALSSENLIDKSNSYDSGGWSEARVDQTIGQTDPTGGTSAKLIDQTSGQTTAGVAYYAGTFGSEELTFSIFLKPNGRTKPNLAENLTDSSNTVKRTYFDLTGAGAVGTKDAAHTASIAKLGDWYRCTITFTPHAADSGSVYLYISDTDNSQTVADDGNGYTVFGANLSTTGQLVTNETSGSIHREYAPLLKTASVDTPRFEYDASGNSEGLLIESQAENLQRYGSAFSSWGTRANLASYSNQAIAPNGQLEADLLVPTTGNDYHYIFDSLASVSSGTTYTFSVYLKAAGYRYVQLLALGSLQSSGHVTFDLETGTLSASGAHTGSIESVGNGFYRASATITATSTTTSGFVIAGADSLSSGRNPQTTGNAYDGWLCWGAQLEANSAASSLVDTGTGSSQLTRASDSCSVATSSFYTGGPVTIVGEVSGGNGTAALADLRDEDATLASYLLIWKASAANTDASNFKVYSKDSGYLQVNKTVTGSGGATTIAVRLDTNNFAACAGGGTLTTDTSSVVLPSGLSKLWIASAMSGYQLDSTIKNLRFYNVALSDTELQAITS